MTSLTDVADKLGFSRASLYYYVEDREDLMFQVYLRSAEIMARRLGEAAQSGRSALQVVGNFISRTLDAAEPELAARLARSASPFGSRSKYSAFSEGWWRIPGSNR